VLRCNTERLPTWRVELRPGASWQLSDARRRHADSSQVRGVWWRRPLLPKWTGLATAEADAAGDQWQAFAEGLASVRGPRWLSDPLSIRRAEDKALQLATAAQVGFRVPETTITNDLVRAHEFIGSTGGEAVAKSLTAAYWEEPDAAAFVYARLITARSLKTSADAFTALPVTLQQAITPKRDIRVTVVDGAVFAAIAEPRNSLDWRAEPERRWEPYELPEALAQNCAKITSRLGLRFSGIDLVVDKHSHWFLELNPNGEWGWLEKAATLPIAASLAEALSR
jgi:glutathione synthase/RimK-type ligase-like ATP-grasp enzyme